VFFLDGGAAVAVWDGAPVAGAGALELRAHF
jgi:hypothetical protein